MKRQAAKIKIVGVGGSGSNAVSRMARYKIKGVELIAINTDAQDLTKTRADLKLRIGRKATQGLGTGMNPEIGRKSALENREEIRAILKGADMVFITCGLGGGCLRASSLIYTNPEGPVRIDSIRPGSTVYTFSNGDLVKKKVLAAMKTGVKKVLELKTNNRTIYASEDHPFLHVKPLNILSNDRFSKFVLEWTELRNLKVGDLVVILKKLPDEEKPLKLPNDAFTDEEFCQLFGFLLGDGWISKEGEDSWKIHFSPSKDKENNQKYLKLIKQAFGLKMKRAKNWYYVGSKKTFNLLKTLGLHKPAREKEIPPWVFNLPNSQKKAFIVGLADADGSYSIQTGITGLPKKEIKFEMSSEKLIKQLKILCDSIGLRTSNVSSRTRLIKPPNTKQSRLFTSWTLRIYKTQALLGALPHPKARSGVDFLYKFRNRRTPEFFEYFGFNRIKSIKEIGDEEVYDITVEGSHNFVAEGFVVHNTGTGAAPIVADLAKEEGALTLAVVTRPFSFEGQVRQGIADNGAKRLKERVDTLIVISNDKLLTTLDSNISLINAFWVCDDILRQAVQSISDLIMLPGIINVDFADVKAIMLDAGTALFGVGRAQGEGRAEKAALAAINSPLLDISFKGAKGILFNVSGGKDISLSEIDQVAKVITQEINPEAKVIFGAVQDEKLKKREIKVTVIATGF